LECLIYLFGRVSKTFFVIELARGEENEV